MDGVTVRLNGWSKWWLLIPVLLLVVQISALPYLEPDAVSYLSMAKSLADRGVMLNLGNPHLTYAVGYPTVLSGVLTGHGDVFLTSSILNAVLGLIYLLGVWRWCRLIAPSAAVWICCLSVANVTVLYLFRRPLSEPLFMALLIWSSICLDQVVRQLPERIDWMTLVAASLLLGMMTATRHVGALLVAGLVTWLGCLVWRKTIDWKQAFIIACVPGLVSCSTALALIYHDQQTLSYAPTQSNWDMMLGKSDFSADHSEKHLTAYLLEGLRIRVYEIGRLVIPGMFGCYAKTGQWLNVNTFIYVPIAAMCFFGWWRLARRHPNTMIMMFPFYFALYVYWPSDQGGRFFTPILPVMFLSMWKSLCVVPMLRNRWTLRIAIIAHTGVALALWICTDLRNYQRYQQEGEEMHQFAYKLMQETGQIGVDDSVTWQAMYMRHLMDRVIPKYDPASANPPAQLVWPVDRKLPPGYVEETPGKRYRLARFEQVTH